MATLCASRPVVYAVEPLLVRETPGRATTMIYTHVLNRGPAAAREELRDYADQSIQWPNCSYEL
jgi:hypothetical protein